jgi:hypothetical protein
LFKRKSKEGLDKSEDILKMEDGLTTYACLEVMSPLNFFKGSFFDPAFKAKPAPPQCS